MRDDATSVPPQQGGGARLDRLIERQRSAALRAAIPFVLFLVVFPLVAPYLPNVLSWFLLGAVVYPFTWLIAGQFVRTADREERETA